MNRPLVFLSSTLTHIFFGEVSPIIYNRTLKNRPLVFCLLTTRNLRVIVVKWGDFLTGVEMIKKLKSLGFKVVKVSKGSHYRLAKGDFHVIVPYHHKELGKGLYNKILEGAGLK